MQPLAKHLDSALSQPKSAATKAQLLQALDMIGGCFASLRDLGSRRRDQAAAAEMAGRKHPANMFFGYLWSTFRRVLQNYADDADVVEKQCRFVSKLRRGTCR